MTFNRTFTTLGLAFIIMTPVAGFSCNGKTEPSCTAQTWTANSCTGNKYCDSMGAAVTQDQCQDAIDGSLKKGLPACTWSTQQVACTWAGSCCTTGGSCF